MFDFEGQERISVYIDVCRVSDIYTHTHVQARVLGIDGAALEDELQTQDQDAMSGMRISRPGFCYLGLF